MTQPKHTNTDGSAAARYATSLLGIAVCAETTAATLSEDWAKVDLKFSFRHFVLVSKLITAHAQVKAGPSYRADSSDEKFLILKVDSETVQTLSGSGMPGLVVWVPPPPMDRLYWYAADPRRNGTPFKAQVKIRRTQYLRPSIRYDLSRIYDYASWSPGYAKQTVAVIPEDQVMAKARKAYKILKVENWRNPLVGPLQVTRLAWRHITRRSKSTIRRTMALRVVPYLKAFLASPPDRYACNFSGTREVGSKIVETRYLMCWYRQALMIEGESYSLLIRIREEITYPANWNSRPLGVNDIRQVATLAAWWCKKDK